MIFNNFVHHEVPWNHVSTDHLHFFIHWGSSQFCSHEIDMWFHQWEERQTALEFCHIFNHTWLQRSACKKVCSVSSIRKVTDSLLFTLTVATATQKYTCLALFYNISDSYLIITGTFKIQCYFLWNNQFHIYIISNS